MADKKHLYKIEESDYSGNYRNDLLEQYKMYVELTDRINERLQRSYYSFLTINSAIVGGLGYFQIYGGSDTADQSAFISIVLAIISYLGTLSCGAWVISIISHRDLYERRLQIINSIEERLPLSLFYAESKLLEGSFCAELHIPAAKTEALTFILFLVIYNISILYHLGSLLPF